LPTVIVFLLFDFYPYIINIKMSEAFKIALGADKTLSNLALMCKEEGLSSSYSPLRNGEAPHLERTDLL
jgi:hypothetical protein